MNENGGQSAPAAAAASGDNNNRTMALRYCETAPSLAPAAAARPSRDSSMPRRARRGTPTWRGGEIV